MPLTSSAIKDAARRVGFDLAGVSAVGDFPELETFPEWIAQGRAGGMRYLESRNESGELKRAALRNAAPWARSVIVCALNYNSAEPYSTELSDPARGWISRYAWSQRDYHDVVLEKLRQLESRIAKFAREDARPDVPDFRSWCYVDTGPLVERVYAKYAGIGWIAKNTCIINQQLGSWLFLGVILTSVSLTPDLPAPDRCGSCTLCLDACPTNAFPSPYQLDPTRCISYLTIEKRGPIPEDLRSGIGRNIFGCDICQDVCPWNNKDSLLKTIDPLGIRVEPVNPAAESGQESCASVLSMTLCSEHLAERYPGTEHLSERNPGSKHHSDENPCFEHHSKGRGFSRAATAAEKSRASAPKDVRVEPTFSPAAEPENKSRASAPDVRTRPSSSEPALAPRPELVNPALDWLASITADEFRTVFRGSPIKRAKFAGVRRNVVTAMGNSGRLEFVPRLQELVRDEDPAVAEHARWALRQLEQSTSQRFVEQRANEHREDSQ